MSDFSSSGPDPEGESPTREDENIFVVIRDLTEKDYKDNSKNELTTKIENIKK